MHMFMAIENACIESVAQKVHAKALLGAKRAPTASTLALWQQDFWDELAEALKALVNEMAAKAAAEDEI